ncbi:hypothetical protein BDA99DRAFT_497785 [Phascolomyces articulosus]|uniref:Uncharacterized protein n=1 Tax=Phascolomyces articulosus TaxID=60185 RepID=A0AAD5KK29_9FUNG|nr:hypothetical protein BDA99DRAFT_497785 [Phascolomyces articulosus]
MTWSDLQYSISFNRDILKNTPFKINIPMQLERIVHDLGGTCHLYEPNDYKDSEGWPTLFEACKLSSCFIKLLFAAKDYWAYSLMLLWNHPNDDTLVTHNLKQVLYPSISSSTSQEYEQLLVRFLGELYDSFDTAGKAIREYPYPNQDLPEFVKLINNSDARIFWIVLYICKLLKEEGVSTADNLTYSLGIIKAFNKCHTWAKPFHISKEQLNSLRSFRDTIFNDEIMCENIAKLWDPEGQETDDMNNAMTIDVFYPFMNPDHRSKQILSILTFCQLCDVFHHHRKNADIREILRVSILQIIEGLQANEERGWFRELAASQTKSRLENWRKEKGLKRRGVLRHIIEPSDKNIILSHIDLLEADPGLQKVLLQTLQLNEEQQVTTKKVHKKYNHIYCK